MAKECDEYTVCCYNCGHDINCSEGDIINSDTVLDGQYMAIEVVLCKNCGLTMEVN